MGRPRLTEAQKLERAVAGSREPATLHEARKVEAIREGRMVAAYHAEPLTAAIEAFRKAYPAEWDALRLCPLQHGLETMIERLSR